MIKFGQYSLERSKLCKQCTKYDQMVLKGVNLGKQYKNQDHMVLKGVNLLQNAKIWSNGLEGSHMVWN